MKQFIIILALFAIKLQAQTSLNFNKRFVECEDQWVIFSKMNTDSSYNYGFIYIDAEAGLTLNLEGTFKQQEDGSFKIKKMNDVNSVKIRLEPNNVKVAIIPESLYTDLQISAVPDWLKFYKTDENTAARQFNWGYMYNGWNECAKGLSFLLKAKELDPNMKGLSTEIAFSYNCLKQYNKAIAVLKDEITSNSTDAYLNKEYIHSLSKNGDIKMAEEQFHSSVKVVTDKVYNAENCFNIMQYYYIQKDKKNFKIWYKELKKWPIEQKEILEYANNMKNELD